MPTDYYEFIKIESKRTKYFSTLDMIISSLIKNDYLDAAIFYKKYRNALIEELRLLGITAD